MSHKIINASHCGSREGGWNKYYQHELFFHLKVKHKPSGFETQPNLEAAPDPPGHLLFLKDFI